MTTTDLGYATPTPKPFTQEEYEQWVASAATDEQAIKAGLAQAKAGLWQTAEALHRFASNSGWLALGHETLGEWLADPDITMTRATYFRLTQAWQELAVVRQVPVSTLIPLDLSKLHIALPALKQGKVQLSDVLSDTESMGARDMRIKYRLGEEQIGDGVNDDFTPTGDGIDDADVVEDPPDYDVYESDDDESATVSRGLAQSLAVVLQAVFEQVGPPERKAISNKLRDQIAYALSLAISEGLLDV